MLLASLPRACLSLGTLQQITCLVYAGNLYDSASSCLTRISCIPLPLWFRIFLDPKSVSCRSFVRANEFEVDVLRPCPPRRYSFHADINFWLRACCTALCFPRLVGWVCERWLDRYAMERKSFKQTKTVRTAQDHICFQKKSDLTSAYISFYLKAQN